MLAINSDTNTKNTFQPPSQEFKSGQLINMNYQLTISQ